MIFMDPHKCMLKNEFERTNGCVKLKLKIATSKIAKNCHM